MVQKREKIHSHNPRKAEACSLVGLVVYRPQESYNGISIISYILATLAFSTHALLRYLWVVSPSDYLLITECLLHQPANVSTSQAFICKTPLIVI